MKPEDELESSASTRAGNGVGGGDSEENCLVVLGSKGVTFQFCVLDAFDVQPDRSGKSDSIQPFSDR